MSVELQFHVASFEGPDGYARAGGLASRVDGLTRSLASLGFETHLWFVGDPERPGPELRGGVQLHRWCQWLSRSSPAGVYQGEEAKERDYTASWPPEVLATLMPHLRSGGAAVVLAEEWQTSRAVVELDRRLRAAGLRERVAMLWNANNLFGFDRIQWPGLERASVVTTVSRIMRHRMEAFGVSPLVLANGLPPESYRLPDPVLTQALRRCFAGRLALTKVARWDPDKAWLATIRAVAHLRERGMKPLLVARGGAEGHESEVRRAAAAAGLRWVDRAVQDRGGAARLLGALGSVDEADVVCLRFLLDAQTLRALYRSSDVVLANSRFEPFGLVGLEAMAVGAVACTGLSGEDYVVPGRNALVIQTEDPRELYGLVERLRAHPEEEAQVRKSGRATARQYAWTEIVRRVLLPRLDLLRSRGVEAREAAEA